MIIGSKLVHENFTLGWADRCGKAGEFTSGQKASGNGQNPTAKPFWADLGTKMSLRQLCQAVFDGAKIGLGVCGRDGFEPHPPFNSLPKFRPFTFKTSSSFSSSRGIVSALSKKSRFVNVIIIILKSIHNKKKIFN